MEVATAVVTKEFQCDYVNSGMHTPNFVNDSMLQLIRPTLITISSSGNKWNEECVQIRDNHYEEQKT